MRKWNHYQCPLCRAVTVARHDAEGVTPFMIRCRATPGCSVMAESTFFAGPQNDDQVAHVIFFRPATRDVNFRRLAHGGLPEPASLTLPNSPSGAGSFI